MRKFKVFFRINTYLINNDYEEIKGDVESRSYTAKNEDEAVRKLHKALKLEDTATRAYDIEIGEIKEA